MPAIRGTFAQEDDMVQVAVKREATEIDAFYRPVENALGQRVRVTVSRDSITR
jgi:hypothetical protein